MHSEYKFHDPKITIFPNLWYKSGSVLKTAPFPIPYSTLDSKNMVEIRFKNRRDLMVRKCEENNDPNLGEIGPEGDRKWPIIKRKYFMMDRVFRQF